MTNKELLIKKIKEYKIKHALELSDEATAVLIHICNKHNYDINASLDQTSKSGGDEGIDAWFYDSNNNELTIYQSKFSFSKSLAVDGILDLERAKDWLEAAIIDQKISKSIHNDCLYALCTKLAEIRENIRKITFILVCGVEPNEMEDTEEFGELSKDLVNSKLNAYLTEKRGKLDLQIEEYCLDGSLPSAIKQYPIKILPQSKIELRKNAYLDLAYIPLIDLINLYRVRGPFLFSKNVRLSLLNTKKARDRLLHPMESTLQKICDGELNSNIFPFYHVGVTISARASNSDINDIINLEEPSIINGCQTITIADNFYKKLQQDSAKNEQIERFKQIKVIAKIVIGVKDEELREITNSNNRQNPIDNWQLFSNDPIHIEIEQVLTEMGVFYERQKGKFDMHHESLHFYSQYKNTNNTYITVEGLGRLICIARRDIQKVAKPSEIFIEKVKHDSVFNKEVVKKPRDIILLHNAYLAASCALSNYVYNYENPNRELIFQKPLAKAYMWYVAIIQLYQNKKYRSLATQFSVSLNKKAPPTLVREFESIYRAIIAKTQEWYLKESKNLTIKEISYKRWDDYLLNDLLPSLGIDLEDGLIPISDNSIDWQQLERENSIK